MKNVLILFLKNIYNSMNYKTHILIFFLQIIFLYINLVIWKKKKNNIHLVVSIINNIIIGIINYFNYKFTIIEYKIITIIFLFMSIINISIVFYKNFIKKLK
jgi:hypothetical protein